MKDFLKGIVYVGLFAIPFIPLIVADSMFFPFITGKNFAFRIIVEVVFSAWVLLALLDINYRPRFSWILSGLSAMIVVMFFANLMGEYPLKSFWSNFERMDGFVTLAHFYLLVVVLGSTFRDKKLWTYFIIASMAAATYVALDGLADFLKGEGSWRIDSTLGNASYMAIYMFFHAFFSIWLMLKTKILWVRIGLAALFSLFTYLLILTATRGTFLALAGGLGLTLVYLLIFAKGHVQLRKAALGGLVLVVISFGSIFALKDQAFIAENPILERITSVSLGELSLRFDIWAMAWEGVKERPLLGWGQGNFDYVFNAKYDPDVYFAETWYDRVHNIALDWLIAGGFVGFLAYVSIFVAAAYYLLWRPFFRARSDQKYEDAFSVPERAVLIGILAGYVVHNLVVFDNIVSYIFFATMLGLIHARVGQDIPRLSNFSLDPRIVTNLIAPVVLVVLAAAIYFVNVLPMQAALHLLQGIRNPNNPEILMSERFMHFGEAIEKDSFAYQEIVEQMWQQTSRVINDPNIPVAEKRDYLSLTEAEMLNLATRKPNDARVHVVVSDFYRKIGALDRAKQHIDIARTIAPTKQSIILEQGIVAHQAEDYEAMYLYFKEALDLQPKDRLARTFYATSLLYTDQAEKIPALFEDEANFRHFALNDFALNSVQNFKQTELLIRMLKVRVEAQPQRLENRISLAVILYQTQDNSEAIAVIEKAVEDFPAFADRGACFIDSLEAGNNPEEEC